MLYICTVVQFLNMGGGGAKVIGNLGKLGNLVFAPFCIVPKLPKLSKLPKPRHCEELHPEAIMILITVYAMTWQSTFVYCAC